MFRQFLPAQHPLHYKIRVRDLFYNGQRHLPGPHHLPGPQESECLRGQAIGGVGVAGSTEMRLSEPKPDDKRRHLLAGLYGVGIGTGFLCLALLGYQLYQYLMKKKYALRKEILFKQNGGLLLQERFSSYGHGEKAKIFTAEELQRATDNYNQNRFLGQGGYGTVYKGMLPDGSIVAVKRSKAIDKNRIEQFINEVVILSQINHRNVVKLLGCCLETELPLLVYEFISNGTLSYHIHQQDDELSLSWEDRLRIASEVAGALAYMHSAASIPIYHRDIKSSNILLDDKYSAKVSDFGTSSFGVVLVELLKGEKPISLARSEEEINLVAYFVSSTKKNRVFQVLDGRVAREAGSEEILAVAKLGKKCLKHNGKKRPTMKEVATELEGLRKNQRCLQIYEEALLLRDEASLVHSVAQTIQESLENSTSFSLDMESSSI
ncbi:hypothetical protein L1049_019420 [Liquidambar formosana]|uniref:Protein kinase domain-containing protein n=1 Tax=Liquidambar formosana TaxID=63359 RepID=A0AAP0X6H7_LIQFO